MTTLFFREVAIARPTPETGRATNHVDLLDSIRLLPN